MKLFTRWTKKSEAAKQNGSGEPAPQSPKKKIGWLFKKKTEESASPSANLKQATPAAGETKDAEIQDSKPEKSKESEPEKSKESEPEKSKESGSQDPKKAPPGKAGEPKLTKKRAALIAEALDIHRQRQDIWKDIDPNLREGLARLVRGAYGLTGEQKTENPQEKSEPSKKNGLETASALTRPPPTRK